MNGEFYRLNIRFDLADERQREIATRLQSLDREEYGSINKFVIAAVGKALNGTNAAELTADEIRSIIREELQEVTFVSAQPAQTNEATSMLTEEEQVQNELSVLDDLEMFG